MSKEPHIRRSISCHDCDYLRYNHAPERYWCAQHDVKVWYSDTCDYAKERPYRPSTCGHNGCDGLVDELGIEGAVCRKCGEWFI